MLVDGIHKALESVSQMSGVSKDDVYALDNKLDESLLKYVNINAFSKFKVDNGKEVLIKALETMLKAESTVSINVPFIIANIDKMREMIQSMRDIVAMHEYDGVRVQALIDGGLTGSELRPEPWYKTLEENVEAIKGALSEVGKERVDTLLENKDKLPDLVTHSASFKTMMTYQAENVEQLDGNLKSFEQTVIDNPTKPDIYSSGMVWLTQHKQPLNLLVVRFIAEMTEVQGNK